MLSRRGLPGIGAAVAFLADTIRDHKHLETLLTSCSAEERQVLYDGVRAHLKFVPLTLDQYVSRAQNMAEREQLPIMRENGELSAFRPGEYESEEYAIAKAIATRTLTLTCSKCTKQEDFLGMAGETKVAIIMKARRVGWIYNPATEKEICPKCPTELRPLTDA